MSNRKLRTNRVEYLYAFARGMLHPSSDPALRDRMIREGFVEVFRVGPYPRKRFNRYRLTDKAYKLLARRSRSLDHNLRLHRSTMPLVLWQDRYSTKVPMKGERKRELRRDIFGDQTLWA